LFTSRDPLGYVDSYDVWMYVGGNPFGLVDPWGMGAVDNAGRARDPAVEAEFAERLSDLRRRYPDRRHSFSLIVEPDVLNILQNLLRSSFRTNPAREVGAVIYRNRDGSYQITGGESGADVVCGVFGRVYSDFPIANPTNGQVVVAIVHTHPFPGPGAASPSTPDMSAGGMLSHTVAPTMIVFSANGDPSEPTTGGVILYAILAPGQAPGTGRLTIPSVGAVDLVDVANGSDSEAGTAGEREIYLNWLRRVPLD
jgi:proteasome lid subunit RPN8/RPN11